MVDSYSDPFILPALLRWFLQASAVGIPLVSHGRNLGLVSLRKSSVWTVFTGYTDLRF